MRKIRIYVASSWRNDSQPGVVQALRDAGHEVYDFRNPPDRTGFSWSEIDPDWQKWKPSEHLQALKHPVAIAGFKSDFDAMKWADVCVLVTPSGRSAHIEAGWMEGAGRPVIALLDENNPQEPDLMYNCFSACTTRMDEMLALVSSLGMASICMHASSVRECRVCGCTNEDCTQCVQKTGAPCYWVADDLCSACSRTTTKN